MNKEKQIEEMAKDIACKTVWDEDEIPTVNCLETAKRLYNAGYRKQSEGEWVWEHDELNDPKRYFIRVVCSHCGLKTGQTSSFCPNCGAKMKGVRGNENHT